MHSQLARQTPSPVWTFDIRLDFFDKSYEVEAFLVRSVLLFKAKILLGQPYRHGNA